MTKKLSTCTILPDGHGVIGESREFIADIDGISASSPPILSAALSLKYRKQSWNSFPKYELFKFLSI